eukprot:3531638-Ditylum_brightwellii.AAC.1
MRMAKEIAAIRRVNLAKNVTMNLKIRNGTCNMEFLTMFHVQNMVEITHQDNATTILLRRRNSLNRALIKEDKDAISHYRVTTIVVFKVVKEIKQ